jgi:hypothetical protein
MLGGAEMAKTAVGLFENPHGVDDLVRELEALGFPQNEVRTLEEPATFEITGVMSFPRLHFEVDVRRELARIGATRAELQAYVEGLRRGGALVFATGSDDDKKVDAAAEVMNRHGAIGLDEITGSEPHLPHVPHEGVSTTASVSVLAGRVRQAGGGACFFVW